LEITFIKKRSLNSKSLTFVDKLYRQLLLHRFWKTLE